MLEHPRGVANLRTQVDVHQNTCACCGVVFTSKRSDARCCSKPCGRKDYYQRHRDHELAGMARWRLENYEYDRQRWARYSERRWGAERQARAEAKEARLAAPEKTCTKCGKTKPKDDFHRDPRRVDGHYSWCKACFYRHCKATEDLATRRLRSRTRYKIPATRERLRAKHRAWSKAHPEKNRQYAARRHRRMLTVTVGKVDYEAILRRDGMTCHLCRRGIADLGDLHFDHVVPIARGGAHSMDNIRPAHAMCNWRKHDKLMSELDWLPLD